MMTDPDIDAEIEREEAQAKELEALKIEHADLKRRFRAEIDATQHRVDAVVHYRNLCIVLGAKPDQMVNSFDRKLCVDGDTEGLMLEMVVDKQELWAEAIASEQEVKRLPVRLEAADRALEHLRSYARGRSPYLVEARQALDAYDRLGAKDAAAADMTQQEAMQIFDDANPRRICPQCHYDSGDNWAQCDGVCPMPGSPHFDKDRMIQEAVRLKKKSLAIIPTKP